MMVIEGCNPAYLPNSVKTAAMIRHFLIFKNGAIRSNIVFLNLSKKSLKKRGYPTDKLISTSGLLTINGTHRPEFIMTYRLRGITEYLLPLSSRN
jgi:hypothetical protein